MVDSTLSSIDKSAELYKMHWQNLYRDPIGFIDDQKGVSSSESMDILLWKAVAMNVAGQYANVEEFSQKAIIQANIEGEVDREIEIRLNASEAYLQNGQNQQCLSELELIESLIEEYRRDRYQYILANRYGAFYLAIGSNTRAKEYLNESQSILSKLDEKDYVQKVEQVRLFESFSSIYSAEENQETAHAMLDKAIGLSEEIGWKHKEIRLIESKIRRCISDKRYTEAYALCNRFSPHPMLSDCQKINILNWGAISSFELEDYQRCKSYITAFHTASHNDQDAKDKNAFDILRYEAKLEAATGNFSKAVELFEKAELLSSKQQGFENLYIICKDLSDFYIDKMGNKDKGIDYARKSNRVLEAFVEEINEKRSLEFEVSRELERYEQEMKMLKLESSKLQLNALRAQMNPHFIYNALNAIQQFISIGDNETASQFLSKFASLMRKSLDYSDRDTITLEEEVSFINQYLEINLTLRFNQKYNYEITIDDEIEEDIVRVPSMIIQPFVENAIEHGLRSKESGKIKINFRHVDDHKILCVVEDNGIGRKEAMSLMSDQNSHKSRSTIITNKRLQLLNNSRRRKMFVKYVDLDNLGQLGCGTRVEVTIPTF